MNCCVRLELDTFVFSEDFLSAVAAVSPDPRAALLFLALSHILVFI